MSNDSQGTFCHKCGSKIRMQAVFCHKCGENLQNADESVEIPRPENFEQSLERVNSHSELTASPSTQQKIKAQSRWGKNNRFFAILASAILLVIGISLIVQDGSSRNAQAAYAIDAQKQDSIASLISRACLSWSEAISGLDVKISDKSLRETDLQYRRSMASVSFTKLDLEAKSAINSSVFSDLAMQVGLLAAEDSLSPVDLAQFAEVVSFCESSPDEQIRPHLENLGVEESEQSVLAPNRNEDDCMKMEVKSPFDSADFYAFSVYLTNNCSYRVNVTGTFYVKSSNGSIYERPSDAVINFHGNSICGIYENYFNYTFNPGESSSDSVCSTVKVGSTVVSYFIANNPDGKPSLEVKGNWTLQ